MKRVAALRERPAVQPLVVLIGGVEQAQEGKLLGGGHLPGQLSGSPQGSGPLDEGLGPGVAGLFDLDELGSSVIPEVVALDGARSRKERIEIGESQVAEAVPFSDSSS